MMTTTDWYPANVTPYRRGRYERKWYHKAYDLIIIDMYSWNGKQWLIPGTNIPSNSQYSMEWRGIKK